MHECVRGRCVSRPVRALGLASLLLLLLFSALLALCVFPPLSHSTVCVLLFVTHSALPPPYMVNDAPAGYPYVTADMPLGASRLARPPLVVVKRRRRPEAPPARRPMRGLRGSFRGDVTQAGRAGPGCRWTWSRNSCDTLRVELSINSLLCLSAKNIPAELRAAAIPGLLAVICVS